MSITRDPLFFSKVKDTTTWEISRKYYCSVSECLYIGYKVVRYNEKFLNLCDKHGTEHFKHKAMECLSWYYE